VKRLLLLLALLCAAPAGAQEPWPSRPITLVVPFGPGVAPDLIARALGERLSATLGQPLVILNRPGQTGLIGGETVAHSKPDGYTLLIGDDALFAIAPHVYRQLPFNPATELTPIISLIENAFILAINPALPATDLASFLALARKANPPLAYASFGNGSQSHLMMERLRSVAGLPLLHVPFRGSSQAAQAVASGDAAAAFTGVAGDALARSGRVRAVATTGAARSKSWPGLPTLAESFPGLVMTNWQGLFAPAGTAPAVLRRIEEAARDVLASDELVRKMSGGGDMRVLLLGSADFAQRIRRDSERYREIVERLGLKID